MELRAAQGQSGMGGWTPISYEAIGAWSRLTGSSPSLFELQLIRRADAVAAKILTAEEHKVG